MVAKRGDNLQGSGIKSFFVEGPETKKNDKGKISREEGTLILTRGRYCLFRGGGTSPDTEKEHGSGTPLLEKKFRTSRGKKLSLHGEKRNPSL